MTENFKTLICREEFLQLKETSDEKIKELELVINENEALKARLDEATVRVKKVETENKMLIDRWMLQKMQDAERLNEVPDLCFVFIKSTNF